ncbi:Ribosomal protein L13 domain [Pseudocohnilembus persalinus]|uniref:Ribosomal protein L13 domain n=1 Tax=Pseudocohnilembus persalinus TaxID=266149 RepID=A0A0V0QGF5_PSEPJ|nr:Ribosomal protein L13 domain [Pseudocohnilembus persalinus]|eukprot:KRX01200.1 Ribosomal protein L13 domain [Pseudocohnilembus persalinus]
MSILFLKQILSPLGRMCQQISIYIRGKHKPTYKPNKNELGDQCIVVNAGDILMTGKKALKKQIFYHTGYVGNLKVKNYSEYLLEKPEQLIIWIISKQLPKNLLRRDLLKKVDIFRGAEHNMLDKFPNFIPKQATFDFLKEQSPEKLALNKNIQITYSSSEEIPAEFSHLQYEKNNEIEVPFKERNQILKMTPHNRQVIKEWRKFFHQRKRYQVHKPKAPKSKQPKIHEQDLYIKSKAQIAKYGLQDKVYPEDSQEVDDETSKAKFF